MFPMPSWPLLRVAIAAESMAPTLSDGEWWIARRTRKCRPGDVVVFDHPTRSGMVAVKRVIRPEGDGWWVEGDNPEHSTDSRHFGPLPRARVLGRLVWRYSPWPPRRLTR